MADKLAPEPLGRAVAGLTGWRLEDEGRMLVRDFAFADFSEAFGFMARVALAAQAADHHPDWSNSYNRVRITLTTHSAGGVTQKDIALAQAIDRLT